MSGGHRMAVARWGMAGLVALGCATLAGAAGAQSPGSGMSVALVPGDDPAEDESFAYTVRVTNHGPRAVSGARLVFAYPPAKFQPTATLPAGTA